jgi:ubiquinone/menaquinone biosynthesis C-methylase UbiE
LTALGRDQLAEYWDSLGRRAGESEHEAVCYPGAPDFLNSYVDRSQRRAVERLLALVGPVAGSTALDVGCGTGRWSRLLSARGADVVAVDRSGPMLEVAARRTPGVRFARMEATSLALPTAAIDLAIEVTVIQHVPPEDQLTAMREIVRVVRPGGFVISLDVVGHANAFDASHGTYPRPRAEWIDLWRRAGAEPRAVRGQDFGYPLALLRLGRRSTTAPTDGPRRASAGWRSALLRALVIAADVTDWAGSHVPRLRGSHLAVLYRVG